MSKPVLLDLFCAAGTGADGYAAAGFEIVGVDLFPQPHYPYEFIQGDVLAMLGDLPRFDALHASPPCQEFTRAKTLRAAQGGTSRFGDLLTPYLAWLLHSSRDFPWVVENVPGAPGLGGAVTLCGSSFGLGVRRHRLFLSNVTIPRPPCDHKTQGRPWGVYYSPGDEIPSGGRTARDVAHGLEVMGVDRPMPWDSLKEGIPPAYTEYIGKYLMEALRG